MLPFGLVIKQAVQVNWKQIFGAYARPTITTTVGLHEILTGAREFIHCYVMLIQGRYYCMVLGLRVDTGALMEQS